MFEQFKLYGVIAAFLATVSGTAYITHRVDDSKYEKLQLQYTQASQNALKEALDRQSRLDELKTVAALEAIQKQQKITEQTKARLHEATTKLKDANMHCITWDFIRVLDATILRSSADSLPIPSGKSPDSCSTFTAAQLARSIIKNYGVAEQNAQQLNDLIDFYNKVK